MSRESEVLRLSIVVMCVTFLSLAAILRLSRVHSKTVEIVIKRIADRTEGRKLFGMTATIIQASLDQSRERMSDKRDREAEDARRITIRDLLERKKGAEARSEALDL
jgi:hypothetical protein